MALPPPSAACLLGSDLIGYPITLRLTLAPSRCQRLFTIGEQFVTVRFLRDHGFVLCGQR